MIFMDQCFKDELDRIQQYRLFLEDQLYDFSYVRLAHVCSFVQQYGLK